MSTSRCRHPEMRAHAKCLDCKEVGESGRSVRSHRWGWGINFDQVFDGSILVRVRVRVRVNPKVQIVWTSKHIGSGWWDPFFQGDGLVNLRFKVLFQDKFLDPRSKDLICLLSNFIFRSAATSFIWRCSRTAQFSVQSFVSRQISWSSKQGLDLSAFKLYFSKCSNFVHLKVLGTGRLRFLSLNQSRYLKLVDRKQFGKIFTADFRSFESADFTMSCFAFRLWIEMINICFAIGAK